MKDESRNLEGIEIIYKESFLTGKPYPVATADDYCSMLQSRKDEIYHGQLGIYLGRKIMFQGQSLYFPFIDVDADKTIGNNQDLIIGDAIHRARLTWKIFKDLGVEHYFFPIASGSTGFRIGSNLLLNLSDYMAFVDFVKQEMRHIIDTKPTEDVEMPYQMLVYKGTTLHNHKESADRHSRLIAWEDLQYGMTSGDYRRLTSGKPNPDEVLAFLKSFFNFQPISDLKVLGDFGNILQEFKTDHQGPTDQHL